MSKTIFSESQDIMKFYLWDKEECTGELCELHLLGAEHSSDSAGQQQPTPGVSECSGGSVSCGVCNVSLGDRMAQLQHYTTDHHCNNQSRVLQGLQVLSLNQYHATLVRASAMCDESKSSDSGSDCSEGSSGHQQQQEAQRSSSPSVSPLRQPRLFFTSERTGRVVSVWRTLLTKHKADSESRDMLSSALETLPRRLQWTYLMQSGGHFAGAVFKGEAAVVHKTFHSYTVRAGQGGSQAACDNKGNKKRSAGASLRRYNEAQHLQHVQEVVLGWSGLLESSDLIFLTGSRRYYNCLLESLPSLTTRDPRIRSVPFTTRRPTFAEINRIHRILAQVTLIGSEDAFLQRDAGDRLSPSPPRTPHIDRSPSPVSSSSSSSNSSRPAAAVTPDTSQHNRNTDNNKRNKKKKNKIARSLSVAHSLVAVPTSHEDLQRAGAVDCLKNVLFTGCKTGQLSLLQGLHSCCAGHQLAACELPSAVLAAVTDAGELQLLELRLGAMQKTALHVATEAGQQDTVRWLLGSGEVDPGLNDSRHRVAYSYCTTKAMRGVYKDFREKHPQLYDYKRSCIPAPLTNQEKEAGLAVKRANKAAHKEQVAAAQQKKEQLLQEQRDRERYLNLSDREKRALAAERRMLSLGGGGCLVRCCQCAQDMTGQLPYHYSDNNFCSTDCVKAHRNNNKNSQS